MTCFISDLTSDNHLALSLSFCTSPSLSHIKRYALDEPGLVLEGSPNHVLMLTVLWVLNKTKMFAFAL